MNWKERTYKKLIIRPIEKRDDEQLYHLIRKTLKAEQLDLPGTAYFDQNLSALSVFYKSEKSAEYFVIDNEDGTIAGGAGFAQFKGEICELQKLYLEEAYRGKGYANLLMEKLIKEAKKDYKEMYLETHTNLDTALKLYEKFGFQKLSSPLEGSEHGLMNRWLIKSL